MPSTSKKQHNFMAAIANNPSFAKKVGVSQSVGKDFNAADKGRTFAKGGVTQQKINKQNTRHGMMDLPVANLSRFSGMKKGGIMKKRRFDNGGDVDMENDGYDKSGEGEDAVYRKSFATGVTASNETPAPKKAAAKPVRSEPVRRTPSTPERATGDPAGAFDYNEDSDGKGTPRPARANAPTQQPDETKSELPEDTRGVSGMPSRKYKNMPTDERKKENADRLAKELAVIGVTGGAGRLAYGALEAARAKQLLEMPTREILKMRNRQGFQGHKSGGKIAGFKTGGSVMKEPKDAMMPRRPRGMTPPVASPMGMKHGGMPMKDGKPSFMKKMMGGGMAKYAKGGGIESRGKTKGTIIRMASGGSVSSASRRADGIAQRGKTRI